MEREGVIKILIEIYSEYGFSKVRDIIDYVNDQDFALKSMQNKIDELEKIINSLATYNCRTCSHNIVEQGFNRVHNHTETCSNCYRCNYWTPKGTK